MTKGYGLPAMRFVLTLIVVASLISIPRASAQEFRPRAESHPVCTTQNGITLCQAFAPADRWRHGLRPNSNSAVRPGGDAGYTGVLASRTFAQPHDIPPVLYKAYGIVAFPALATADTKDRFRSVCAAYLATLPASSEVDTDVTNQMVTVWPVNSSDIVAKLATLDPDRTCQAATENYNLATALTALKEAKSAGVRHLDDRGPYLLAWSPASAKGQRRTLVLVLDLSSASTIERFKEQLSAWRERIEQDPELWEDGFSLAALRDKIRYWVDHLGAQLLSTNVDPQ